MKKRNYSNSPSPYDLSAVPPIRTVRKKQKNKRYMYSVSPYDLSAIDMEERRKWFAKNRSRL